MLGAEAFLDAAIFREAVEECCRNTLWSHFCRKQFVFVAAETFCALSYAEPFLALPSGFKKKKNQNFLKKELACHLHKDHIRKKSGKEEQN